MIYIVIWRIQARMHAWEIFIIKWPKSIPDALWYGVVFKAFRLHMDMNIILISWNDQHCKALEGN